VNDDDLIKMANLLGKMVNRTGRYLADVHPDKSFGDHYVKNSFRTLVAPHYLGPRTFGFQRGPSGYYKAKTVPGWFGLQAARLGGSAPNASLAVTGGMAGYNALHNVSANLANVEADLLGQRSENQITEEYYPEYLESIKRLRGDAGRVAGEAALASVGLGPQADHPANRLAAEAVREVAPKYIQNQLLKSKQNQPGLWNWMKTLRSMTPFNSQITNRFIEHITPEEPYNLSDTALRVVADRNFRKAWNTEPPTEGVARTLHDVLDRETGKNKASQAMGATLGDLIKNKAVDTYNTTVEPYFREKLKAVGPQLEARGRQFVAEAAPKVEAKVRQTATEAMPYVKEKVNEITPAVVKALNQQATSSLPELATNLGLGLASFGGGASIGNVLGQNLGRWFVPNRKEMTAQEKDHASRLRTLAQVSTAGVGGLAGLGAFTALRNTDFSKLYHDAINFGKSAFNEGALGQVILDRIVEDDAELTKTARSAIPTPKKDKERTESPYLEGAKKVAPWAALGGAGYYAGSRMKEFGDRLDYNPEGLAQINQSEKATTSAPDPVSALKEYVGRFPVALNEKTYGDKSSFRFLADMLTEGSPIRGTVDRATFGFMKPFLKDTFANNPYSRSHYTGFSRGPVSGLNTLANEHAHDTRVGGVMRTFDAHRPDRMEVAIRRNLARADIAGAEPNMEDARREYIHLMTDTAVPGYRDIPGATGMDAVRDKLSTWVDGAKYWKKMLPEFLRHRRGEGKIPIVPLDRPYFGHTVADVLNRAEDKVTGPQSFPAAFESAKKFFRAGTDTGIETGLQEFRDTLAHTPVDDAKALIPPLAEAAPMMAGMNLGGPLGAATASAMRQIPSGIPTVLGGAVDSAIRGEIGDHASIYKPNAFRDAIKAKLTPAASGAMADQKAGVGRFLDANPMTAGALSLAINKDVSLPSAARSYGMLGKAMSLPGQAGHAARQVSPWIKYGLPALGAGMSAWAIHDIIRRYQKGKGAEEPKDKESKLSKTEKVELRKEAAQGVSLADLRMLKARSDERRYREKAKIARQLIEQSPEDFYEDSSERGIVGLTHAPTGFRFHLPRHVLGGMVMERAGVPMDKLASMGAFARGAAYEATMRTPRRRKPKYNPMPEIPDFNKRKKRQTEQPQGLTDDELLSLMGTMRRTPKPDARAVLS
jgi:hypothetical protein